MSEESVFRAILDDASAFTPVGETIEPLLEANRRDLGGGARVFRASDGYETAIPEEVVDKMLAIARDAAPREAYGLLAGRLCRDDAGLHTIVDGVVMDPHAVAGASSIRTTHESELATREDVRRLFPESIVLGWFHTHPRYGLMFSGTDRRNQATWTRDYALGVVADPWTRDKLGVYRGHKAEHMMPMAVVGKRVTPSPAPTIRTETFAIPHGERVPRLPRGGAKAGTWTVAACLVAALLVLAVAAVSMSRDLREVNARLAHLERAETERASRNTGATENRHAVDAGAANVMGHANGAAVMETDIGAADASVADAANGADATITDGIGIADPRVSFASASDAGKPRPRTPALARTRPHPTPRFSP